MSDRLVAGVDGCPGGWVAAIGPVSGSPWIAVAATLRELMQRHPKVMRWAVDMPIGLAESDPRECDLLAQQRLGPLRRASVFPAPVRLVVEAGPLSYEDACRLSAAVSGKKISRQTWNLIPKIREVRRVLIETPRLRRRVFECHPELAFARLAGGEALAKAKKEAEGRSQREALLGERFGRSLVEQAVLQTESTSGVGVDDTLDALACWTVASRSLLGEHETLPVRPVKDADGLPIAIVT